MMSSNHKIAPPETPTAQAETAPQGPVQAETCVCLIDVPLRARILLPKRTTKQLGDRSPSGLSTQASTPTKQLLRNGLFVTRLAAH